MYNDIFMSLRTTISCDDVYDEIIKDIVNKDGNIRDPTIQHVEKDKFTIEYDAAKKIGPYISFKRVREHPVGGWAYNMRSFIFYQDIRRFYDNLYKSLDAERVITTDLRGEQHGRALIDTQMLCSYYIRFNGTSMEKILQTQDIESVSSDIETRLRGIGGFGVTYCKVVTSRDTIVQIDSSQTVAEYKIGDDGLITIVATPLSDSQLSRIYSALESFYPLEFTIASVDNE